jgi:uncharacterized protein with HEPN domain
MLPDKTLKYILDMESILQEIDLVKEKYSNYESFSNDFIVVRAIERQLEIIGEAANKLRNLNPDIQISSIKQIVNLRNLIIHSYDSVDAAILWGIIQKDIPKLKLEIEQIRKK